MYRKPTLAYNLIKKNARKDYVVIFPTKQWKFNLIMLLGGTYVLAYFLGAWPKYCSKYSPAIHLFISRLQNCIPNKKYIESVYLLVFSLFIDRRYIIKGILRCGSDKCVRIARLVAWENPYLSHLVRYRFFHATCSAIQIILSLPQRNITYISLKRYLSIIQRYILIKDNMLL